MASFALEVITPYREFFSGQVESIVFPASDGLLGVEPGHEPVVTLVEPGTLRYRVDGQWQVAAISQGLAQIMPEYVSLFVGAAEKPEEIDLNRAEAARQRAEAALQAQLSEQDLLRAKMALTRALARINTRKP